MTLTEKIYGHIIEHSSNNRISLNVKELADIFEIENAQIYRACILLEKHKLIKISRNILNKRDYSKIEILKKKKDAGL